MRRSPWRNKAAWAVVVVGAGWLGLSVILPNIPWRDVPGADELRQSYRSSETRILDRNGVPLQVLRLDFNRRQLDWKPLERISPALKEAVLEAEDRRFRDHDGVDWLAMARAVAQTLLDMDRPQGASTITMQLSGMIEPALRPGYLRMRRSLAQKRDQILYAWSLEQNWQKPEILEAYLNLVSFRGEIQGIGAAARAFFDKSADALNRDESALLAAMLRAPNARPEHIAYRACILRGGTKERSACPHLTKLARSALQPPYRIARPQQMAPHMASLLRASHRLQPGMEIRTTLDHAVQKTAMEAVQRHVGALSDRNLHDAAVLVLENATGRIMAYVGSSGRLSEARLVDGIRAPRQAGSTLKPFIYGLALEQRYLTASSLLDDSAIEIPIAAGGVYRPRNYDNLFHGPVRVREALASSLNVPAVRAVLAVGPEAAVERLEAIGFRDLMAPEFYGASLALGSADVTLWDLTNAYRMLANGGKAGPITYLPDETPDLLPVMDPGAVFIISDILADRRSRALAFGLESPLSTPFFTAVKTGTSKDMRDNWTVGFSERYTVGVWAGNFSGAPMWHVSGISGAGPIWREMMEFLHRDRPSNPPPPPPRVESKILTLADGGSIREWYLKGTAPARPALAVKAKVSPMRIQYPTDGAVLALDPDIPDALQRVIFKATGLSGGAQWLLDGNMLADTARPYSWRPTPGEHQLILASPGGRQLDRVQFQVR